MPILTPEERVGTDIAGKYRLERILGRGGMAVIYESRHLWTEREVAIKILNYEYAQDEGIARRFLQEARTAAGLKHPNVVDVLDMGRDKDTGTVYLVLEYLTGEPFSDLLEHTPMLEPEEALELLLPVMDALDLAHSSGIVHRDLKPDNIFISRSPKGRRVPKLLDFGIAKVVQGNSNFTTQTGAVIGTPEYMSPEQVRALPDLGPSADVWSMGVVLFEALTGTRPFDGETPTSVLAEILTTAPPKIAAVEPSIPAPLAVAVDRALIENREIRYASMAQFARALLRAADECGLGVDRVTVMPRSSSQEVDERAFKIGRSETIPSVRPPPKKTTPGPATQALATPAPGALPSALADEHPDHPPHDGVEESTDVTAPLKAWSESPTSVAPRAQGPSRRLLMAVLGGGLSLALLGGGALYWSGSNGEAEVEPPVETAAAPTRTEDTPTDTTAVPTDTNAEPATVAADPPTTVDPPTPVEPPVEPEPVEAETMEAVAATMAPTKRRTMRAMRAEPTETSAMEPRRGANDTLIIR